MRVNKQVYEEAKEALYSCNVFSESLIKRKPRPHDCTANVGRENLSRLRNGIAKDEWLAHRAEGARSLDGIDFASIRHVTLHFWDAFWDSDTVAARWANYGASLGPPPEPCSLCKTPQVSFLDLQSMKKLRSLRVSMAYSAYCYDSGRYPLDSLRWCKGLGPAPPEICDFMRTTIAAVPEGVREMQWGLDERLAAEARLRDDKSWQFVDERVLSRLADEFWSLKGTDPAFVEQSIDSEPKA
jgi:hypothetical protein